MHRAARAMAASAALAVIVSGCAATKQDRLSKAMPRVSSTSPLPSPLPSAATATEPAPRARPVRTPCTTNRLRKWVFVSLRRQHMWMCAGHRVAYATPITSGMVGPYTNTPTGRYHVQGLNRNTTLTLNTGATYPVRFWIPFDAPLFGFHDSSWQHFPYGSPRYKTRGSHGCVHMPLKAIRFFYGWADIGTPVRLER
jgi:hypothetical protein